MLIFTFDALAYENIDKGALAGARQPIPDTRRMYEAMYERYSGRIIIMGDSTIKIDMLDQWAKREGLKFASVDVAQGKGPKAVRDRVRDLNAVYGKIEWFVDTNPETITLVMQDAIPSILLCLPNFVRPEWRDGKPREKRVWDDLTKEIEVQSLYRSTGASE